MSRCTQMKKKMKKMITNRYRLNDVVMWHPDAGNGKVVKIEFEGDYILYTLQDTLSPEVFYEATEFELDEINLND